MSNSKTGWERQILILCTNNYFTLSDNELDNYTNLIILNMSYCRENVIADGFLDKLINL